MGGLIWLAIYGSTQVIRPRRSEHRDDPAGWGLPCEEVEFRASVGVLLRAWLARGTGQAAVIVLHGFGGNRHTSLAHGSFLYPEFTLLLPDFRGHGESEGHRTSVGYLERLDVIAAAGYLRSLGYGPIGVFGVSRGGATAILAAADSTAIDAIAADSSFAQLRDAVGGGARRRGYPAPLSGPLAYLSCRTAAWRLRHRYGAGDPVACVAAIAPRPLLLIHGEADTLIRIHHAHALYSAAAEPKELWVVPEIEHARAIETHSEAYHQRVADFFRRSLRSQTAAQDRPAPDLGRDG
jgi:fermentation-respiration switch protein FrsA (DUF1100 family)